MTKEDQEWIIRRIKGYCDNATDCMFQGDNCMFFIEEHDDCIFRVLGLDSPFEWDITLKPDKKWTKAEYLEYLRKIKEERKNKKIINGKKYNTLVQQIAEETALQRMDGVKNKWDLNRLEKVE